MRGTIQPQTKAFRGALVRPAERRFVDLHRRSITAGLLAIVAAVAAGLGGWPFIAFCSAVAMLMCWELTGLADADAGYRAIAAIGGGLCCLVGALDVGLPILAVLMAILALTCARWALARALLGIYGAMIILACLALIEQRMIGWLSPLWIILTVMATDIGGYFAGRLVGGPPLASRISPGKTLSGSIGALLCAAGVGLAFRDFVAFDSLWLGIGLSICAQVSDLAESALKRRSSVKDSSALLPGHGGFLDRFDGFVGGGIFVAVADAWGAFT